MQYIVGIDIGGTFTDFVSYDSRSSKVTNWKTLSRQFHKYGHVSG